MAGQKYVLVYIGDTTCPACISFTSTWERLVQDSELKQAVTLQSKIFTGKKVTIKAFDFIDGFPTIALVPAQYYSTEKMGQYAKIFTGPRTLENIKSWTLLNVPRQMPVVQQPTRAGPNYRPVNNNAFW